MAIEMINKWFGIEKMDVPTGTRFLVRTLAGVHANYATRAEAIAWIADAMTRTDTMGADEPEATAEEYFEATRDLS